MRRKVLQPNTLLWTLVFAFLFYWWLGGGSIPAFGASNPMASAAPVAVSGGGGTSGSADPATIGDPFHLTMMIVYITIAIGFSFLCSVSEAVVLSITPAFIASLDKQPSRRVRLIKQMKTNIDRTLAAILTLNTIAHTVGAGGAGAEAAAYFGPQWVGVSMAVLTLLILFLSEIVPKTIGAVYWRRLVGPTAIFVRVLTIVLLPLIFISELLTRLLTRGKQLHVVSREELAAMAEVGAKHGQIDSHESNILKNLFQFSELTAEDVMTPRTVMFLLPQTMTVEEVLKQHEELSFSRIPIYGEHRDDIRGFVLKYDILLSRHRDGGSTKLEQLKRDLRAIRGDTSLAEVLESMLNGRDHILLVIDQYGGTEGLVSLEDMVETLIGMEIVDEADPAADMRAVARKRSKERLKRLGLPLSDE